MSARYTGGLVYNAPGGWSAQFNGSNYLRVTSATALTLGSGDFCIEMWLFPTAAGSNPLIWGEGPDVGSNNMNIHYNISGNGTIQVYIDAFSGSSVMQSSAISQNTWTHVAVTRSGSTFRLFINGSQSSTYSNAGSVNSGDLRIGASYVGYISNSRTIKGSAIYTANFTPPVGQLQAISGTSLLTCAYPTIVDGSTNAFSITNNSSVAVSTANPFPTSQLPNPALGNAGNGVYTMSQYAALKAANLWPAYDPYYKNVTLNLHGDGTNGAQNNTFVDSSTNNFTITRNGNTTQGTFTPYGSNWSNYFGGASDYLTMPDNANYVISGDFTAEAWIYPTSFAGTNGNIVLSQWPGVTASNQSFQFYVNSTGKVGLAYGIGGTNANVTGTSLSCTLNTWNHIAVTRSGTTVRYFVNGALDTTSSTVSGAFNNSTGVMTVGRINASDSGYFSGYISNCRLVVGTALYTAAFTPSTTPLTAVSGTQVLVCQSSRFLDASSNNATITVGGTPSVQRFSPFSPTTAYSTSVIGGSGYFDGSGDYLSLPTSQTPLSLGSSDFTFEAWIYRSSGTGGAYIFVGQSDLNTIAGSGYDLSVGASGSSNLYSGGATIYSVTNPNAPVGAWAHCAWVRTGGTFSSYLNGTRVSTVGTLGSSSINSGSTTYPPTVGALATGSGTLTGFISGARLIKGSGGYDATQSTITIPTAPPTAVTNTSLLLNYTNAAILDNAMMNDLETVGNAQISTSVKKYGTGSMYFDGTGDYLTVTNPSPIYTLGGSQFTIEGWVYFNNTSSPTTQSIISKGGGGFSWSTSNGFEYSLIVESGVLYWQWNNGSGTQSQITATPPSNGTWTHIAVTFDGTYTRLFFNGVQQGSSTTGSYVPPTTNNLMYVGGRLPPSNPYYLNGYIDDLRITKGVARYTANFTPPTSQVQDQ